MKHFNFILLLFVFTITSCSFFSYPEATTELVSTYTEESKPYYYLYIVIKITNSSNKNIYNSTISIKADSTKRSYYKTTSSNITIKPENSIFITLELSFTKDETSQESTSKPSEEQPSENNDSENSSIKESNTEKWIEDSVEIVSSFWN